MPRVSRDKYRNKMTSIWYLIKLESVNHIHSKGKFEIPGGSGFAVNGVPEFLCIEAWLSDLNVGYSTCESL